MTNARAHASAWTLPWHRTVWAKQSATLPRRRGAFDPKQLVALLELREQLTRICRRIPRPAIIDDLRALIVVEKEIQDTRTELAKLEKKIQQASTEELKLRQIKVVKSSFKYTERGYGGVEPILIIRLRNDADQAISRFYAKAIVKSPERAVPWVEDSFNYSIAGGLEPGEELEWTLTPGYEWSDVPEEKASGVETKVYIYRVDGADRKVLWKTDPDREDQTRHETLTESLEDLTKRKLDLETMPSD